MSVLPNARREAFARALATGASICDAQEQAGYKRSRAAGSRLAGLPDVAERVAELQAVAAKRMEVTIDSLAKELEEARLIAIAEKQAAAAVSATMGKAKLFGFGVENKRISGPGGGAIPVEIDLSKVSNEQLDALEALFGKIAGGSGGDDDGDPSGEAEAGG